MRKIENRHTVELNRMYDKLETLEPGTEEHEKVLNEIMKAKTSENEKYDRNLKIVTFGAGLLVAPAIDLICKRNLAKYIGTVEQMETFTSMAGRSISSWFKWK